MPGELATETAVVQCPHMAMGKPMAPLSPLVKIKGSPVVTAKDAYTVVACPGVPPNIPPCVSGAWTPVVPSKVKIGGQFVIFRNSLATVTPQTNGVLTVRLTQFVVRGK